MYFQDSLRWLVCMYKFGPRGIFDKPAGLLEGSFLRRAVTSEDGLTCW